MGHYSLRSWWRGDSSLLPHHLRQPSGLPEGVHRSCRFARGRLRVGGGQVVDALAEWFRHNRSVVFHLPQCTHKPDQIDDTCLHRQRAYGIDLLVPRDPCRGVVDVDDDHIMVCQPLQIGKGASRGIEVPGVEHHPDVAGADRRHELHYAVEGMDELMTEGCTVSLGTDELDP